MKSILLVIQNPSLAELCREILEPEFNLVFTDSDEEGIRIFSELGHTLEVILEEEALAVKSNYAFADYMKSSPSLSSCPMLAITETEMTVLGSECLAHGFHDFIPSYAPREILYNRIKNVIGARESLSLKELERTLKTLPSCIMLKDINGRYVFSTKYLRHIFRDVDDPEWTIRGKSDMEIRRDKENARKAMEADRQIIESGKGMNYIIEEHEDGIREFLQLIKEPVFDDDGRVIGIVALINNVTDYQLLKIELEKRSKTDLMTGLLNKTETEFRISGFLSGPITEGESCALLMIDVDDFKSINDNFGHEAGDQVLTGIGRILCSYSRESDIAGRIGGDEFMVFLRMITPEASLQFAERIQRQVTDYFRGHVFRDRVSLSIGIATYPDDGDTFEELYKKSDEALYYVKQHGKAACRLYGAE